MRNNGKFIELVVNHNTIKMEEINVLLEEYGADTFNIFTALVERHPQEKDCLCKLWGDSLGFSYVHLKKTLIQANLFINLPQEIANIYKMVPIYKFGDVITMGFSYPNDLNAVEEAVKHLKCNVSPVFCYIKDIEEAIEEHYKVSDYLSETSKKLIMKEFFRDKSFNLVNSALEENTQNERGKSERLKQVSKATADELIETTRQIYEQVLNNKTPEMAACIKARNIILNNIVLKANKIEFLNEYRIEGEFTYTHAANVAILCGFIGKLMGFSEMALQDLIMGAFLHDIGKNRIPKEILLKSASLTREEFNFLRKHPILGYQVIKNIGFNEKIAEVALHHHEKTDGSGYPNKLPDKEIDINSKIVTIVDIYDIMSSHAFFGQQLSNSKILNILLTQRYKFFNPEVFDIFVKAAMDRHTLTQLKSMPDTFITKFMDDFLKLSEDE